MLSSFHLIYEYVEHFLGCVRVQDRFYVKLIIIDLLAILIDLQVERFKVNKYVGFHCDFEFNSKLFDLVVPNFQCGSSQKIVEYILLLSLVQS